VEVKEALDVPDVSPRQAASMVALFRGWRIRTILKLGAVRDICIEIRDTMAVLQDMAGDTVSDSDNYLQARLAAQLRAKRKELADVLEGSRWVKMRHASLHENQKPAKAHTMLKRGSGLGGGRAGSARALPEDHTEKPVVKIPEHSKQLREHLALADFLREGSHFP